MTDWEETFTADTSLTGWTPSELMTKVSDSQPPSADATPRARFRVGDSYLLKTSRHCNFAGTDCWHVRVHPVIDSISASTGAMIGGQELTIVGRGLNAGTAEVTVDG